MGSVSTPPNLSTDRFDPLSRLNLYAVLHSLPDGVTLANSEGRIIFSNEAADRILGVKAATEATPDEWSDHYGVFLPDRETPFPTDQYPLFRALSGTHTRDVEMFVRNAAIPDGVVLSVSGQPLRDGQGDLTGAAVVFRDITKLRDAQQKLEKTVGDLVRTQRMKDELSGFIVHDLKNPLTAILTTCGLLAADHSTGEGVTEDVRAIHEAAERIHGMVLDLLDVQLAEDGALQLERSTFQVAGLFRDVESASVPRLAASRQRLEVSEPDRELSVRADRSLLFRVVMNLVDNCAKYGPRDGTVWIDATQDPESAVVICVSDEGPGVPSDLQERIFEKYAQVERDHGRRSKDSRGLGLRFCKLVVEAHGGRIWVEDREPVGARFCVELPAAP